MLEYLELLDDTDFDKVPKYDADDLDEIIKELQNLMISLVM